MNTLESISRKIEVAEDLRSVVTTLRSLSAVGLRECERAVEAMTTSVRLVQFGFQVVLRHHPRLIPETPGGDGSGRTLGVVFGSDQGLCGPLNRTIAAHALERLPDGARIVAVGSRVGRELEVGGAVPAAVLAVPNAVDGFPRAVGNTLLQVDRLEGRPFDRIVLIHHRPRRRVGYEPRISQVFPLDTKLLRAIARRPWPSRSIPQSPLDPTVLFDGLVRHALSFSVYRAFAEAKAAEHAARLATMTTAEQNISERLEDLGHRFRQQRQESIMAEILDVLGGFEAVRSDD